jgi:hypothetical protein
MMTREKKRESVDSLSYKQDLELRSRLSQLYKIMYDQFILCLSFSLGKLCGYQLCNTQETAEAKLYNQYMEHIHLLFINKKI